MRLLIDTNVALFMWMNRARLSKTALSVLEDSSHEIIFSQLSSWEICLKHRTGKLPLPDSPASYLPRCVQKSGLNYQPITDEAIYLSARLPAHHADPFDRLLISTALTLSVPIVSADNIFSAYPVERIW